MDENLFSWFGHFYWLKGDEKMARIISIVNQKGGTGKSACTANLAGWTEKLNSTFVYAE